MEDLDYSNYTILAVDDVPLNLLLVEKMLTRFGFKVKKASGGQEALNMIEAEQPSLVLLDLMMPNIDGYDVLARLRSNPETQSLPVIILSALNSDSDVAKGIEAGANDYITKPIIMDKLVKTVKKHLVPPTE